MNYRIALCIEDGGTCFIDCDSHETVLDAAYRNGINLPMSCLSGVCGTCKCRCERGEYDLGEGYSESALTAEEAAAGDVLTCQMKVSSDCVLRVPEPSGACSLKPAEHVATVVRAERFSNSAFILTVRPDDPAALAFLPGQYVRIEVPGTGQYRTYSFSSKPGAAEATFLIRHIPEGVMTTWLTDRAAPGMALRLIGPHGSFFLRPVPRPIVMLAGGTGVAPILSMLEVLADQTCDLPIRLVYRVNCDDAVIEAARIAALGARLPGLHWTLCVADPDSTYPLKGNMSCRF